MCPYRQNQLRKLEIIEKMVDGNFDTDDAELQEDKLI